MGESHHFLRSIIGWRISFWLCLGCIRELQWDPSDRWTTCHSQRSSHDGYITELPYIQTTRCIDILGTDTHSFESWLNLFQWKGDGQCAPTMSAPCHNIAVPMRGPCSEPSLSGHPRRHSDELSGPSLPCCFCVAKRKFTAVKVELVRGSCVWVCGHVQVPCVWASCCAWRARASATASKIWLR